MYSVYFSSESGERANSRRSSCLRSINRSVRKSFPSQVNRSNAKKHGGFPRRNIRFLNCGRPRLSREQISPSMTALTFGRQSEIDSASAENEANGCPLRDQLSTAMLDDCECPEAIHFQFVNPIRIIERSGSLQQRRWLERKGH